MHAAAFCLCTDRSRCAACVPLLCADDTRQLLAGLDIRIGSLEDETFLSTVLRILYMALNSRRLASLRARGHGRRAETAQAYLSAQLFAKLGEAQRNSGLSVTVYHVPRDRPAQAGASTASHFLHRVTRSSALLCTGLCTRPLLCVPD